MFTIHVLSGGKLSSFIYFCAHVLYLRALPPCRSDKDYIYKWGSAMACYERHWSEVNRSYHIPRNHCAVNTRHMIFP